MSDKVLPEDFKKDYWFVPVGVKFVVSLALFRAGVRPGAVSPLWYLFALPVSELLSVPSALVVKIRLEPPKVPLRPQDMEQLEQMTQVLSLQCFTPEMPLQAAIFAWKELFAIFAEERPSDGDTPDLVATLATLRAADLKHPTLEATELARLTEFMQNNEVVLRGVMNALQPNAASKGECTFKDFVGMLLAVQGAFESSATLQEEICFRLMDSTGKGAVSRSELAWWVDLLAKCGAFEEDAIVTSRGWLGGENHRLLAPPQLAAHFIAQHDKDRDGHLSLSEFQAWFREHRVGFALMRLLSLLCADAGNAVPVRMAQNVIQHAAGINPQAGLAAPGTPPPKQDDGMRRMYEDLKARLDKAPSR